MRHDGVDHADYVEQLTNLLFVKMCSERAATPEGSPWHRLSTAPEAEAQHVYRVILNELMRLDPRTVSIFAETRAVFRSGRALRAIVESLDSVNWTSYTADVQASAYEYLLGKAAADGKQGAGQYFTPRQVVRLATECLQPGVLPSDSTVSDPAAGTAGFLVEAWEWQKLHHPERKIRYVGIELVERARRLGAMNLLLHQVPDWDIALADALTTPDSGFDVVLANPPFGSKGTVAPDRADFWMQTSNKAFNFVQHIVNSLADGGRAAIVLPDSCFFGQGAASLLPGLHERCNVHTLLRLPDGTFAPYTAGTKTNLLFLTKGSPTQQLSIYDARSGLGNTSSGRSTDMVQALMNEFTHCYGPAVQPSDDRASTPCPTGRWRSFDLRDLSDVGHELGRLSWELPAQKQSDIQSPVEMLKEAFAALQEAAVLVEALIDIAEVP